MLHNLRRLCSYGLCCVLLVSCLFLTPTKAAVDYPDDGVGFWKMMSGWVGARAIKTFLDVPLSDARDIDWKRAYDAYVNTVNSTLNTSTLVNGGVRYYFETSLKLASSGMETFTGGKVFSVEGALSTASDNLDVSITSNVKSPFLASAVFGYVVNGNHSKENIMYTPTSPVTEYSTGSSVKPFGFQSGNSPYFTIDFVTGYYYATGYAYVDLFPISSSLEGTITTVDLSSDIRLGSLSNSWAYVGDDGIVTVDNSQLFNETTNNFYNPATNETIPVTDWNYDYSDRSYGITLDDGRIGKIVYGDDSASVNLQDSNGNTITYNYYYTMPGGSGGGSGDGEDGEGNWFTDLLKKLGELLGGVLGGLLEIVGNALLTILDSLITLVSSSVERLANLVNLFGSFGDALSVLWSWLPPDVVTILVAGVTVIVMVAVVKMFL